MDFHSQNEEKRFFYLKVLVTAYHGRFKVLRPRSSAGRVLHQLDLQTSAYPLHFLTLFHPTISPNNSFLVSTACTQSLVVINFSCWFLFLSRLLSGQRQGCHANHVKRTNSTASSSRIVTRHLSRKKTAHAAFANFSRTKKSASSGESKLKVERCWKSGRKSSKLNAKILSCFE